MIEPTEFKNNIEEFILSHYGLTDHETHVLNRIEQLAKEYADLPEQHKEDTRDFNTLLNNAILLIMKRVAVRMHPKRFEKCKAC